jgi:prepilin-type N-terminal cleavage/methylation domain-containing protein
MKRTTTGGLVLSEGRKARVEGFTLIEIMISIIVLSILVVGIYSAFSATQGIYATGISRQEIQDRVRRALNAIALELRQASAGTGAAITFGTAGTAGDESVTFSMCTGFTAGAATYGSPITITSILGDDEADNGLDDNNNRLVDERKVLRTQAGVINKTLADNLQEGSLRFTRTLTAGQVDRITITLSLQGVDNRGQVIVATDSVTVDLRNR